MEDKRYIFEDEMPKAYLYSGPIIGFFIILLSNIFKEMSEIKQENDLTI